jgi:hypothetical protein
MSVLPKNRGRLLAVLLAMVFMYQADATIVYLSRISHPGALAAAHAFGVVTAAFTLVALIAGAIGYRATRYPIALLGSVDLAGAAPEQRGHSGRGGGDDPGRDVQREVHPVGEGVLGLGGDGSAQVRGDRDR